MFRVRLKMLRENAGYSQYSFADKFGVSQSTVGNWEAGKREPNFSTMQRLADFFGVSVDFLLGRDEAPALFIESGHSKEAIEFAKEYADLTAEDWEEIEKYARFLIGEKKAKKEDKK